MKKFNNTFFIQNLLCSFVRMKNSNKAILLGLVSASFFSTTYIFNKSMALGGGDFLWTASLRYLITLPFILVIALFNKQLRDLLSIFFKNPKPWIVWGTIGFGFFYFSLTAAAAVSPAWLIAGTFQTTIIAGLLLSPLIYTDKRRKIPKKALKASYVILVGVALSQIGEIKNEPIWAIITGSTLVIISATLFPLGNRMILLHQEKANEKLSPIQRVACMTLGSIPFWILISAIAFYRSGLPQQDQVVQSGMIALFSTIIATVIFFKATEMAGHNAETLGAVEATQSIEIIITLIAEIIFLNGNIPSVMGITGILIIMAGMFYYTRVSSLSLSNSE